MTLLYAIFDLRLFPTPLNRLRTFLLLLCLCGGLAHAAQGDERKALRDKIALYQARGGAYQKDSIYIDLLTNLGHEIRYYNLDSLYLLSSQALKYSKAINYKKGESKALIRIGDYYVDVGALDKALTSYTKARDIAESLNNRQLLLTIINNQAGVYDYKGDYAKSLAAYLEGIEVAKEIGDNSMLSVMNENIGGLYASQKDYEQALEFYKRTLRYNKEINDEIESAKTFSNLGDLYADMGELDYAMFHVNKAIAVFEKRKKDDWLAFAYEVKGKVYLKEQNYKWAIYWFHQSKLLHERIQDERGKINLYNGLAEAHLGLEENEMAEEYAMTALQIANNIQFKEGSLNCAEVLYRVHKRKGDYQQALEYNELYQQLSDTLSRNENKKMLAMLKTKSEYDRQKLELMQKNEEALAKQQIYVNIALFILLIFVVVTFIVLRAQKIQKRLNQQLKTKKEILEKRERELRENNQTKNKLFSIIGHDLRGPIGALQGLLSMLKEGEIEKEDFWEFIPKLRDDVDHILFTLNNLLSWGQTQMNGAVTKPAIVDMHAIVSDNVNLLKEVAQNKAIKIINDLPVNSMVWADANQVDIIVRNLISNALKFTPENGMVFVQGEESSTEWQIAVRDTGIGMDQITKDKLFNSRENITTYGTNNEKGTGLGLSLCKEMVEKNKGEIWVETALRKGTCFFFTLPKKEKSYSKAS